MESRTGESSVISHDDKEWLAQVRRDVDRLKVTIQSNGRLDENWRVAEASTIESCFKACRQQVDPE